MKTTKRLLFVCGLSAAIIFAGSGCKKDEEDLMKFNAAKIKASFTNSGKTGSGLYNMIQQTPSEYQVALYSAKLMGTEGTPEYQLFYESDFSNAHMFHFTGGDLRYDLPGGTSIPDGKYFSIEFGIYYLQMRIQIGTTNRGIEWRNMRIYFCEHGMFKKGDVVQVDNQGNIQGWLFGENQMPDFDPVSPRTSAYTHGGDGTSWYMFDDKSAQFWGPYGNMAFWNSVPEPYNKHAPFNYTDGVGETLVIDFNVHNCWEFEDVNGDGYFGGHELNPNDPTPWHMNLPAITISQEN